jgi:hypothetical protein
MGDSIKTERGDWWEARDVHEDKPEFKPLFDEILTGPVDSVHIEQMSESHWWMAIYKGDRRLVVTFSSKNHRAHVQGRFELE